MRRPRASLRVQLTLLYAVPFFFTGAVLLTIPLLQASETVPAGTPFSPPGPAATAPQVHNILTASAVAIAVMVPVSFGLGWLISGRFLRPLRAMTATARDISATNLHRRLNLRGRDDEFRELGRTLDDLFARLEASFESQRHFVANASHELRTPLTAERALLQVALADPEATADSLRAACRDVLALSEQQERLIDGLLTLASSNRGIERWQPFDLADLVAAVARGREVDAERRGLRLEASCAPAPMYGDPSLVESLVTNLVDNALRHNVSGGRVWLATAQTGERAALVVRNTGPVIPPSEVDRLFQPFQQLRGPRLRHTEGHGLGLAIVRAIAAAHGATLAPRPRADGGLDIEVAFCANVVRSR
jgi:signal transduction histidine kinase